MFEKFESRSCNDNVVRKVAEYVYMHLWETWKKWIRERCAQSVEK